MNAVDEEFRNSGDEYDIKVMKREMSLVSEYLPCLPNFHINDPNFLKFSFAKPLVRDVEKYLRK
jgi:hypothetical protein